MTDLGGEGALLLGRPAQHLLEATELRLDLTRYGDSAAGNHEVDDA